VILEVLVVDVHPIKASSNPWAATGLGFGGAVLVEKSSMLDGFPILGWVEPVHRGRGGAAALVAEEHKRWRCSPSGARQDMGFYFSEKVYITLLTYLD
jgi:hypothetical protein